MGHVRNYSIGDALARYKRMTGHNVLHPMGWDAFGLPAENAAHRKQNPSRHLDLCQHRRHAQAIQAPGFSATIGTGNSPPAIPNTTAGNKRCSWKCCKRAWPTRRRAWSTGAPTTKTVLANEQVENGRCWRCGTEVVQQELDQWFLKITDYAEELLSGHDILNAGWPEPVLTMQKNWIGKSYGTEIQFALDGLQDTLTVFTTRPDTLFGATFMSVAPEHPLVKRLCFNLPNEKEVLDFVDRIGRQDKFKRTADDMEKEGIFTGGYAINPATGARIPIYAANFVLFEYGTGAVMAVPAHDQRDFEFATKYGIEKKVVIQPPDGKLNPATMTCAYTEAGTMVNSGPFDGTPNEEGKQKVTEWLAEKGVGKQTVNYRLRDWGHQPSALLGLPGSRDLLRGLRHRSRAGERPSRRAAGGRDDHRPGRLPLGPRGKLRQLHLPHLRQTRTARHRHLRHLRGKQLVHGPLLLAAFRKRPCGQDQGELLVASGPIHRRYRTRRDAPDLLPFLVQGHARPGLYSRRRNRRRTF